MKNSTLRFLMVLSSIALGSNAMAEGWDGYNNPANISRSYNYSFNSLPKSGQLSADKMPWSETYWPSYRGGIAVRWQTGISGFGYGMYSKEQLMTMGPEAIASLSAAEKFDILQGRYDYPTVQGERSRVSAEAAHWEGICHGWVPASLQHRQPEPKTFLNPDGIEVRFGSSDIKGLISYYYGVVRWKPSGWIGKRCSGGIGGGCRGVNPGTFHVVISNQLGLMNRGFVADVDRGSEVWNQPVYAFSSRVLKMKRNKAKIQTVMSYVNELRSSQWAPQARPNIAQKVYEYTLEFNDYGQIVGGNWDGSERPGYLWQHDMNDFAHPYYGSIKGLLNDAPAAGDSLALDRPQGSILSQDEIMTMANDSLSNP